MTSRRVHVKAELIEASSLDALVHGGARHRTLLYLIRDGMMGRAHLHAIGVMHGAASTKAAVLLRSCNGTLLVKTCTCSLIDRLIEPDEYKETRIYKLLYVGVLRL